MLTSLDKLAVEGDPVDANLDSPADAAVGDGNRKPADLPDVAPDGGALEPCSGNTFCDGFERSALLGAWDQEVGTVGTISLSSDGPRSGSSFLRILVPSSGGAGKNLQVKLGMSKAERLSYSARVDSSPPRGINIGSLAYEYDARRVGVFFVLDNGMAKLVEEESPGSFYVEHASRNLPIGRWFDISIAVDHTTTPQTVKAVLDGETVFEGALARSYPPGRPIVIAGIDYASSGPQLTLDVDDVRVELTPP
jgi:hypothetical protein